jgi:nucleotide-binding universal stress UspA family protein
MEKRSILVAVDFTESSDVAFAAAMELARKLGYELDLVHITIPIMNSAELLAVATLQSQAVDDGRKRLNELAERARAAGLTARAHAGFGSAVFGVLDFIDRLAPEMVIVGSHGKGPIRRALVGSVADGLCRRSPVPVMVVPAPARRAVATDVAWACRDCGHILKRNDGTAVCSACGAAPASWISAPIEPGPVDAGEPAVGDVEAERLPYERTNDPAGLFSTSPPGTSGTDVNPELRVRY